MRYAKLLALVMGALVLVACIPLSTHAGGQQSEGNTDGLLTWRLGSLAADQSARQTVLFVHAPQRTDAAARLDGARTAFRAGWSDAWAADEANSTATGQQDAQDTWINNEVTDFALAPDGAFFWEAGQRQALRRPGDGRTIGEEWTPPAPNPEKSGGQLSRLSFYLHYSADGSPRRSGIKINDSSRLDGLRVVQATRRLSSNRALTVLETADGCLRLEIRSALGEGAVAAQEYVVRNMTSAPVTDARLSVYVNLEADHSPEDDQSRLDPELESLVTLDPRSGAVCLLAGVEPAAAGWSGVWPSQEQLAAGSGLPRDTWQPVADLPPLPVQNLAGMDEPPTRSLTSEEADRVIEADWLLQAEGASLLARAAEEIAAARELARQFLQAESSGELAKVLNGDLAELTELERALAELQARPDDTQRHEALYLSVRRIKRRIVFRNPLVDFDRVVFVDQPYPHGREWQHQARHRNGMMATPGGRLLVLEGLSPAGKLCKLADLPPGSYWRPDLSFDGQRVLFCFKPGDGEAFHLYEVNVDGTGLRQLTDGPFDDLDPIYLPDGGIAFVSTRSGTFVRCMPYTYVYTLCRADGDGSHIRMISHNNEPDWTPSLLDDGRILYSRWEYTDKALWRIQSLWTVRPDGTQHTAFYGNQSVWPDHLGEARQIPGTNRVMFTGMAHHNYFAGTLGIIDPARGSNYPAGLSQITSEIAWPECGRGPSDDQIVLPGYQHRGRVADYKSPYPLSEDWFLVSINTGPFNLYLMDVRGNKELIYRGQHNAWYGLPVRPRSRPPALSNLVAWPGADRREQKSGVFFSSDVYEQSGIPRGLVKYIRVLKAEYHTFTTWDRDFRFEGPAVSVVEADNVKSILGIAPVEADGSFQVQVPAGVAVHFQLLDERQRALQTMRSFTGVMPGEVRGCVGCHEGQSRSSTYGGHPLALRRGPSVLEPPPWGNVSVSFERLVQPVLNTYCARCHDGAETSPAPNLRAVPGKGVASPLHPGKMVFSEPYLYLIRSGLAGVIGAENYDQRDPAAYRTLPPMTHLSLRSKLLEMAESGQHHGVVVDEVSRQQLIGWIDANGPYRGLDDIQALGDPRCCEAPVIARP